MDTITTFFDTNPEYVYLILGVVCIILFIGILLNKNWAIDPANFTQKFNYELFGRKLFRIVTGLVFLLGAIASVGLFIYYKFYFIH